MCLKVEKHTVLSCIMYMYCTYELRSSALDYKKTIACTYMFSYTFSDKHSYLINKALEAPPIFRYTTNTMKKQYENMANLTVLLCMYMNSIVYVDSVVYILIPYLFHCHTKVPLTVTTSYINGLPEYFLPYPKKLETVHVQLLSIKISICSTIRCVHLACYEFLQMKCTCSFVCNSI